MVDRARVRSGRSVSYNPTAAEETANGPGPWPAMITDVDADGDVDLLVHIPGDGLADLPAALAAFTDPPNAAEMALLRTLVNNMRGYLLHTRKTSVAKGSTGGTYSLEGEGATHR